jgi:hypothetical protein
VTLRGREGRKRRTAKQFREKRKRKKKNNGFSTSFSFLFLCHTMDYVPQPVKGLVRSVAKRVLDVFEGFLAFFHPTIIQQFNFYFM